MPYTYILQGCGLPPSVMPSTEVVSVLNNRQSSMIAFRNPFAAPIHVAVTLLPDEPKAERTFEVC